MKNSIRKKSTAWKLTSSFVVLGILPLAVLAVLFLWRYSITMEGQSVDNLNQMCQLLSVSTENMIDSVDRTMAIVYDYENEDGRNLTDIITDRNISKWEKHICVNDLLQDMLNRNSDISSIRFITKDDVYAIFRNTEKELLEKPRLRDVSIFPDETSLRSRVILPTVAEAEYCDNSQDFVFTIVRNYMNVETVEKAGSVVLGTMYVDINVDTIGEYASSLDLRDYGEISVFNPKTNKYIYSSNGNNYNGAGGKLDQLNSFFDGNGGAVQLEDVHLIYSPVAGTDLLAVIVADRAAMRKELTRSIGMMIITVSIVVVFVFFIFFSFSGKVSEPARELKRAMQEVESGNLDVVADIKSGDEMEYLGTGFNNMVRRLNYYIEQVYVAQICRNEAELNALKLQIQPHFLYNTLDVIRMTALDQDDPKTAELLECLSAQMRYVLNNESEVVPLRKEIENIKDYFAIIKVRYQGRMELIVNIKTEDMELAVPRLLLQPLVENAVKHGLREKEGTGHVILESHRGEDYFEITVMDDGVGVPEEQADHIQEFMDSADVGSTDREGRVGIGMKNIHDRIRLDYGEEYGLLFTSYVGMGTVVKIRLPLP